MRLVGMLVVVLLSGCVFRTDPNPFSGLGQGDVTGVLVGVPPGTASEENVPLEGARIRVGHSAYIASSKADGRFFLRNLPEGKHRINMFWDPDHDGVVDLAAVVTFPIRIPNLQTARTSVDVGTVVLLKPGTIHGRVEVEGVPAGDARLAQVVVAVEEADAHTFVDPVTSEFSLGGLGEGPWTVVAGFRNVLSVPVAVDVTSNVITTLPDPLQLRLQDGIGIVSGRLVGPRGEEGSLFDQVQGLDGPVTVSLIPVDSTLAAEPPVLIPPPAGGGNVIPFRTLTRAGLYTLLITPSPEAALPIRVNNVLVLAGTEVDVGDLPILPVSTSDCVDLDGDGACALVFPEAVACVEMCRTASGADLDHPCPDGNRLLDCDDDGDGESDVLEAEGPTNPLTGQLSGPCHCGVTGPVLETGTCANDPTRTDRDFDGVCDSFDLFPDCAINRVGCDPQGAEAPGVPRVFIPAVLFGTPVTNAVSLAQLVGLDAQSFAALAVLHMGIHLPGAGCPDVQPDPGVDGGFFAPTPTAVMVARYNTDGTCTTRNVVTGGVTGPSDYHMALSAGGRVVVTGTAPDNIRYDGQSVDAGLVEMESVPQLIASIPPTGTPTHLQFIKLLSDGFSLPVAPRIVDVAVFPGAAHDVTLLLDVHLDQGQTLTVQRQHLMQLDTTFDGYVVLTLSEDLATVRWVRLFQTDALSRGLEATLHPLVDGTVQLSAEVMAQVEEISTTGLSVQGPVVTQRFSAAFQADGTNVLQSARSRPLMSARNAGLSELAQASGREVLRLRARSTFSDEQEPGAEPALVAVLDADAGIPLVPPYTIVDVQRAADGGLTSWTAVQGGSFQQVGVPAASLRSAVLDTQGGAVIAGSFARALSARDNTGRGVLLQGASDAFHAAVVRIPAGGGLVTTRLAVPQDPLSLAAAAGVANMPGGSLVVWGAFSGRVAFGQHPQCVALRAAGKTLSYVPPGGAINPRDGLPFVWLLSSDELDPASACALQPPALGLDSEGSLLSPVLLGTTADLMVQRNVPMDLLPWGDEDCVSFVAGPTCFKLNATTRTDDGACSVDTQLRALVRQGAALEVRPTTNVFPMGGACSAAQWTLLPNQEHVVCVRAFAGQQLRGVQLGLQVEPAPFCN